MRSDLVASRRNVGYADALLVEQYASRAAVTRLQPVPEAKHSLYVFLNILYFMCLSLHLSLCFIL